jgi:general secretion pathway protein D
MDSGPGTALPAGTGGQMFSSSVATSGSELDDVRVVADDENNALMIYATGKQYKIITDAMEQLDVVATQVIIEASILEVTLTDDLRYGLEWTFKNGLGGDYDGVGQLADSVFLGPLPAPGFSYTVTNSIGDISAVLNALASESLLNVISTPSVMVLDNHTAYIHVGQQVPVNDQQTQTDGGSITQSVTYRDSGVKLTVTPSVNAGGLVTMNVEQSVTDIGPVEETTGQRRFLERNIVSRVAVRSNETIVLGGLIREKGESTSSGIPFLHSIPIIGSLFGKDILADERTELLVIITPRALYNESELREVSEEMRSQVRFMELIEQPPL